MRIDAPTADDPLLGRILDARYRVDREIGKGGFGTVYAGLHLTLDMPVAIKVFRLPDTADDERRAELLAGFMEEARLISRLRHDNVVRMLDQGFLPSNDSGRVAPYAVMEFCAEGSLRELLDARHGAPLPMSIALGLIEGVVSGIRHAHEQGIAHRDLKPANVMVFKAKDGTIVPRIIDFGIAKLIDPGDAPGTGETNTRSSNFSFTPAYAAPEQAVGGRTGVWTDVHAIGLLFVELLTGKAPYGDEDVSLRIIDPVRPTPAISGVDAGPFEPVIARCLAIRPNERYADAAELQDALRGAVRVLSLSPTQEQRTVRPAPRSRRALLLGAGALALAGAGSFFAYRRGQSIAVGSASVAASDPPPPPVVTASATASAPAPIASPRLATLSVTGLVKRMTDAGLPPITPPAADSPTTQLMLNFRHATSSGAVYLNQVGMLEGLDEAGYAMFSLLNVRSWIAADRKQGFELAYAVQKDWVLSMTWAPRPGTAALDLFRKVGRGMEFDIEGCSWTDEDATADARLTRKLWFATDLRALTALELLFRLEATGATVKVTEEDPFKASLQRTGKSGAITLFEKTDAQDARPAARIDTLRRSKTRFSHARAGSKYLIAQGPLADAGYLQELLAGITIELQSEPA